MENIPNHPTRQGLERVVAIAKEGVKAAPLLKSEISNGQYVLTFSVPGSIADIEERVFSQLGHAPNKFHRQTQDRTGIAVKFEPIKWMH
jgi:hypothetical protein